MKKSTALLLIGMFAMFLISLLFQSCNGQPVMKTYTVSAGSSYASPSIVKFAGDVVSFSFVLTKDWAQLYQSTDNSTHKICGVRDFLGSNSLRLGVRRAPTQQNGLIAIPYTHSGGTIEYTPFKGGNGKNVILMFDTTYRCTVYKTGDEWRIDLMTAGGVLIATATKRITIKEFGRIVSGTYIEVGDQPSPWTIRTLIGLL